MGPMEPIKSSTGTLQPRPGPDAPRTEGPTAPQARPVPEIGGAPGPDPTRYGDWQHKGRVSDF